MCSLHRAGLCVELRLQLVLCWCCASTVGLNKLLYQALTHCGAVACSVTGGCSLMHFLLIFSGAAGHPQ